MTGRASMPATPLQVLPHPRLQRFAYRLLEVRGVHWVAQQYRVEALGGSTAAAGTHGAHAAHAVLIDVKEDVRDHCRYIRESAHGPVLQVGHRMPVNISTVAKLARRQGAHKHEE